MPMTANRGAAGVGAALMLLVFGCGGAEKDVVDPHLKGIEVMGGFGDSVASPSPLQALRLWPTDMVRGADDHLYVSSEGRVWDIDTVADRGTIVIDAPGDGRALPSGTVVASAAPLADGGFLATVYVGRQGHLIRVAADRGSHTVLHSATAPNDDLRRYFGRIRASGDGARYVALFDQKQFRDDGIFPLPDPNGEQVAPQLNGDGSFLPLSMANDVQGLDSRGRPVGWMGAGVAGGSLRLVTATEGQQLWFSSNVELLRMTDAMLARRFVPRPWADSDQVATVWQLGDGSWWSFTLEMPKGETTDEQGGKTLPAYRGRGLYRHR